MLTGTLPETTLGSLGGLTVLDLSDNKIEGSLPSDVGRLSQLRQLNLWRTRLAGRLPTSLAKCSSLDRIFLAQRMSEHCS